MKDRIPKMYVNYRERNKCATHWRSITTKQGVEEYNLQVFEGQGMSQKYIVGFVIQRQSNDTSITKKWRGQNLINNDAFFAGTLTLKRTDSTTIIDDSPLEYHSFDSIVHDVADFDQVILEDGFDWQESKISFKGSGGDLVDNEVIRIGLIYMPDYVCQKSDPCDAK